MSTATDSGYANTTGMRAFDEVAAQIDPAIAAALTVEEKFALGLAHITNLTPPERREMLHFLGYPEDLPKGPHALVHAVWGRISARLLADRESAR